MHKKVKGLKKALSLILAFVMVCGMMVFTANAAFTTDTYASLSENGNYSLIIKGVLDEDVLDANDEVIISKTGEVDIDKIEADVEIPIHYYVFMNTSAGDSLYDLAVSTSEVPGLKRDFGTNAPLTVEYSPSTSAEVYATPEITVNGKKYMGFTVSDPDAVDINGETYLLDWDNKANGVFIDFIAPYVVGGRNAEIKAFKDAISAATDDTDPESGYDIPLEHTLSAEGKSVGYSVINVDPTTKEVLSYATIDVDHVKLVPFRLRAKVSEATINYDFGQNKFNPVGTYPESKYKDIKVDPDQPYEVDPDFTWQTVQYDDPAAVSTTNPNGTMVLIGWDTDGDDQVDKEPGDVIAAPVGDTTFVAVYDELGIIGPRGEEIQIEYKLRNIGIKDDTKGLGTGGITWPGNVAGAIAGQFKIKVVPAQNGYSAVFAYQKDNKAQTSVTVDSRLRPTAIDLKKNATDPKQNWEFKGYYTNETAVDADAIAVTGTNNTINSIDGRTLNDKAVVYIYLLNGTDGPDKREPIDLVITYPDGNTPVDPVSGNDNDFKKLPKDLPYAIYESKPGNPKEADETKPVLNSQNLPSTGTAEDTNDPKKQAIPLDLDDIPDPTQDQNPATDNDRRPVAKDPQTGKPVVYAEPVDDDNDGTPDRIRVIVTYEDPTVPLVPNNPPTDPVIDGTDPGTEPNDPVNPQDPIKEPVDRIAVILFMSDGQLLPNASNPTIVRIKDIIVPATGRAVIPQDAYPSNFVAGQPVQGFGGGNNFLDWKFKGANDDQPGAFAPNPGAYGANDPRSKEYYYIMEAEFDNKVKLTVNNDVTDKDDGTTTTVPVIGPELEVDPGTYVKVVDDNNDPYVDKRNNDTPAVFGPVNSDSTWTIPEGVDDDVNDKAPRKGDKIFDGNYEPDMENGKPKVYDENGEKVIYVRPVYVDPEEVIVIPPIVPPTPPVVDETDGLTTDGIGYTIRRGLINRENEATILFSVAFKGKNGNLVPADATDIPKLSATDALAKKFDKTAFKVRDFGDFVRDSGKPKFTYIEEKEGYGFFSVKYNITRSSVVKVTMTCTVGAGAEAKSSSNDHYVILTGDYNADKRISLTDVSYVNKMLYNENQRPKKASEGTIDETDFIFELIDMNKDGNITLTDVSIENNMLYDLRPSNSPLET